jgi:Tol biopolymer transport system component
MVFAAGTRLGPYEIQSALGAGGMGEVYKARDTRLDRSVAIKVLAPEIAGDPDLRARFEREARAVAALDHPHICGIYDVGEANGTHFIVMPYLDGQTLAERLEKGPLPLDQTLKIAAQVADALDKAHRQGFTHRDLKPANIMLVRRGGPSAPPDAKLLDFGLAKLRGPAAPISMSGMTRLGATPNTAHGTILGTVHYMAPEQVEGRDADARTDIWALGVVIYEMTTGKRPFEGQSPASIIGAILKDVPPPMASRHRLVPPTLDHIVSRCLAKDPDDRWQSARDVMLELQSVREPTAQSSGATVAPTRWRWPLLIAAGLTGLACGALVVWLVGRSGTRAGGTPVIEHAARMTHQPGFSEWPTWSPDGKLFAFTSNRDGNFEIYVRRVDGGQEVNVTNSPADDVQPAFSPDGTSIAFVSTRASRTGLIKTGTFIGFDTRTFGGDIWVTPALGGQARRLAEDGNFPIWSPNGRAVIYVTGREDRREIFEAAIDGGRPTPILPAPAARWDIVRLAYSPNARWITFETADRQVFAMPAGGGSPTELLRGSSHVWDPSGWRLYYVNQEAGEGTRVEAADLQEGTNGPAVAHLRIAGVNTGTLKDLAMASDRQHLLAVGIEESMNLTRLPLNIGGGDVAGPEEELSTGQVRDGYPAVSPDGRRIAVGSNRLGEQELWIVDVASRRWERVQMSAGPSAWATQACWSHDNQHMAVRRFFRNGTSAYWLVALDGSSAEQLLPPREAVSGGFACNFSPDNTRLVLTHRIGEFSQLFVLELATRREQQLTTSPSHKYEASWSPDGRWLAFSANTTGWMQVWRIPAAGGPASQEQQMTTGFERMFHPFYSPDGRWLYLQPSHRNIQRMPADGGPLRPVTHFPESGLFLEEPTISPDGRWLVYNRGKGGSSLWMLTLGTS